MNEDTISTDACVFRFQGFLEYESFNLHRFGTRFASNWRESYYQEARQVIVHPSDGTSCDWTSFSRHPTQHLGKEDRRNRCVGNQSGPEISCNKRVEEFTRAIARGHPELFPRKFEDKTHRTGREVFDES
ncbi:uncharacterized protein LOC144475174 [Augochlora pura]